MPDALEQAEVLAVAGVVQTTPLPGGSGKSYLTLGPAAGWLVPSGIGGWEQELSVVARRDMTVELARKLRATHPAEQIAPKRFPLASEAVQKSPVLALSANLAADVRSEGVRVHTIGVDRVSAGFFYFAEGGAGEPVRVQGNLVEMLAPSIGASSSNAEIAALQQDLVDRLLYRFSGGSLSELDVELAHALPRMSRDGTGLVGTDLEAFEAAARALAERSARWQAAAKRLVEALTAADDKRQPTARVPLFGEATKEAAAAIDVLLGGSTASLVGRPRWTVRGAPREEAIRQPTPARAFSVRAATPPRAFGVPGNSASAAKASADPAQSRPVAQPTPAQSFAVPRPAGKTATPTAPQVSTPAAAPSPAPPVVTASAAVPRDRNGSPNPAPVVAVASTSSASAGGATAEPLSPQASVGEPMRRDEPSPRAPAAAPAVSDAAFAASAATAELASAQPTASAASYPGAVEGDVAPPPAAATEPVQAEPAVVPAEPTPAGPDTPHRDEPIERAGRRDALEDRADVPAAAMAPTGKSSFSPIGIVILVLLAIIAYFVGRWIRHRYLDMP